MPYPFVDIHTHKSDPSAIALCSLSLGEGAQIPAPPYTAGIHPWSVTKVDIHQALAQLNTANILAVGEIGLDFAVKEDNRDLQIQVFKSQLQIAVARNLPVIIHCVKALDKAIEILSQYPITYVVFHGFIGNAQQAKQIIKLGYYISLNTRSLSSPKTAEAMAEIPLEKLFLETDASDVTIEQTYAIAAQKLAVEPEKLKKTIYENYKKIFR